MTTAPETTIGTDYVADFIHDRCHALGIDVSERQLAAATGTRPPCPSAAWFQERILRGVYAEQAGRQIRTMPTGPVLAGFARALQMRRRDAKDVFLVAMGAKPESQRLRDLRGGVQPKTTRDLVFQEP